MQHKQAMEADLPEALERIRAELLAGSYQPQAARRVYIPKANGKQRPIAVRENRQWKTAVAYCRYADDFVVIVKGTKAQARAIREECRAFLEGELKLTLNMAKTHVTHVNDGFTFLGHRIIRKRGPRGTMRPVTTIPKEKLRNFVAKLAQELSGNYSENKIDMVEKLNRQLAGWANFYRYTDYSRSCTASWTEWFSGSWPTGWHGNARL